MNLHSGEAHFWIVVSVEWWQHGQVVSTVWATQTSSLDKKTAKRQTATAMSVMAINTSTNMMT